MKRVIELRPMEPFRLWLRFSDGTSGQADLGELAGKGVFAAWLQPGVFQSARINSVGAIEWPGEIDLCPDSLYLRVTGQRVEELFPVLPPDVAHA